MSREVEEVQWKGFWRHQPNVTTSEGWAELPGIYPAGGDDPTDKTDEIAARLLKRAQAKPKDGFSVIEVKLFATNGDSAVERIEVFNTIGYRKREV